MLVHIILEERADILANKSMKLTLPNFFFTLFISLAGTVYAQIPQIFNQNSDNSANVQKRYDFKAACKDCREFIEELEKLINGGDGLSEAYLIIGENEELVLKEQGFMSPLHLRVEYLKAKISSLEGDYSRAEKKIYWLFDALEYRKRGQIEQELTDVRNYLTEEQLLNLDSLNREAASTVYSILRDKNYLSLSVEDLRNASNSELSEIVSDLINTTRFSGFKFEEKYALKSLEIISVSDSANSLSVYRVNALLALGHLYTTRSRITPITGKYQESNRYEDLEKGFYYYNKAVEEFISEDFISIEEKLDSIATLLLYQYWLEKYRPLVENERIMFSRLNEMFVDLSLTSGSTYGDVFKNSAAILLSELRAKNSNLKTLEYQYRLVKTYRSSEEVDNYFGDIFFFALPGNDSEAQYAKGIIDYGFELVRSDENSNLISNLLKARIYGLKAIIEVEAGNSSNAYAYIERSENYARKAAVTGFQDTDREEKYLWSAVLEALQFVTDYKGRFDNPSKAKSTQDFINLYKTILGNSYSKVDPVFSKYDDFSLNLSNLSLILLSDEPKYSKVAEAFLLGFEIIGMTIDEYIRFNGGARHFEFANNMFSFDLGSSNLVEILSPEDIYKFLLLLEFSFESDNEDLVSALDSARFVPSDLEEIRALKSKFEKYLKYFSKYIDPNKIHFAKLFNYDALKQKANFIEEASKLKYDFSISTHCSQADYVASELLYAYTVDKTDRFLGDEAIDIFRSMYENPEELSNNCRRLNDHESLFNYAYLAFDFGEEVEANFWITEGFDAYLSNLESRATSDDFYIYADENKHFADLYLGYCSYPDLADKLLAAHCRSNILTALDLSLISLSTTQSLRGAFYSSYSGSRSKLLAQNILSNRGGISQINNQLEGASLNDFSDRTYQETVFAKLILEENIRKLTASVSIDDPAAQMMIGPLIIDMDTFQSKLDESEAVLVVKNIANNQVHLYLVTDNKVVQENFSFDIDQLDSWVESIRNTTSLVGVTDISELPPFDYNSAYELFKNLISPFESDLRKINKISLVTNTSLQSIPLTLLVTTDPQEPDFDEVNSWAYKHFDFTRLPSLRSVIALRKNSIALKNNSYLGIGDPLLSEKESFTRGLEIVGYDNKFDYSEFIKALPRLPNTREEIRDIASNFDPPPLSTLLLGSEATETNFNALDLSRYSVISFATHGLLRGQVPGLLESALVMTPGYIGGGGDGLLTASEIASLELQAEIVILSACNTYLDRGMGVDSLSGLASAFLVAGAQSLLVTHWEVETNVSAFISTSVVDRYKDFPEYGLSNALASTIDLVREVPQWSHPAFWAPFSVIADRVTK